MSSEYEFQTLQREPAIKYATYPKIFQPNPTRI